MMVLGAAPHRIVGQGLIAQHVAQIDRPADRAAPCRVVPGGLESLQGGVDREQLRPVRLRNNARLRGSQAVGGEVTVIVVDEPAQGAVRALGSVTVLAEVAIAIPPLRGDRGDARCAREQVAPILHQRGRGGREDAPSTEDGDGRLRSGKGGHEDSVQVSGGWGMSPTSPGRRAGPLWQRTKCDRGRG